MKCSACGGPLEDGFLPDVGNAQTWVAVWVAGEPNAESTFMKRLLTGGGVKMDGVNAKMIDAKRCKSCGHLELYATRDPAPGTTLPR